MRQGTFPRRVSDGPETASPAKTGAEHSAACLSDLGCSRDHNEDSFGEDVGLGLWVIADGMGGHAAGEVASGLAVSQILRLVAEEMPVADAVSRTHDFIRRAPSQGIGITGMGTTVVVAQIAGANYRVCWVGDSRAYVHGPDGLRRITVDHTYVQGLLDSGAITAEEARVHPERNVVTQCLGADEHPDVEVGEVVGELYRGEVLLLCTDGLTTEVEEADVAAVLGEQTPIAEKARRLVEEANARGGSDNITVALIPAPADARRKPALTRTREIPCIVTGEVRAARLRRRAIGWTGVAAGIAAVLTAAWLWRDRVVEIVPALLRYAEAIGLTIETGSSRPGSISSFDVPRSSAADREGGEGRGDGAVSRDALPGSAAEAAGPAAVEGGAGAAQGPRMRIGEELGLSLPEPRARQEGPPDDEGPGVPASATRPGRGQHTSMP